MVRSMPSISRLYVSMHVHVGAFGALQHRSHIYEGIYIRTCSCDGYVNSWYPVPEAHYHILHALYCSSYGVIILAENCDDHDDDGE